ncbi:uncharacterized protein SPPG_08159 [Spizellomyces punctatus DAOM BR117]|uniref:Sugar phosphate transporter domain-containing protein n=1 Tax=Spizellomyces punctatus (strain DAOM BR117) TaxID=645134 RepID=A0A0L0H5V2_SPIPD|nr:uncharacterized protein SPPG_08159 [Spizellomyces punctatus DAOM BR117]KNC96572.1 hypothetical protein SPPG_08159 [Spizellomyces punctatus DAOM BR117]|eukprot:XP_016604612.1 hypothetical protein SPPG_08159 [Spizellomyces punctatus DAOM BR117]
MTASQSEKSSYYGASLYNDDEERGKMDKGPENQPFLDKGAADSHANQTRTVTLSVLFYMVVSITLLMVNKAVLLEVALPVTFLWAQLLIAVALLHIGGALGWFTLPRLEWTVCRTLWSLMAINVIGLTVNTYTIHFGDASFYQVARGLVLPFTVILSWIYLDKPSSMVLLACGVVTTGYAVGTLMESAQVNIPLKAVAYGTISSFTTALHAIIIKTSMGTVKNNTIALVYYNNVLSAMCMPIVMMLNGEMWVWHTHLREVSISNYGGREKMQTFIAGCLLTGTLGFLLNVASFFQIKITSPVTHVVSSAARGVLQTILAVWIFNDTVTIARASSILVIIFGSGLYTWIRHHETLVPKDRNHADKLQLCSSIECPHPFQEPTLLIQACEEKAKDETPSGDTLEMVAEAVHHQTPVEEIPNHVGHCDPAQPEAAIAEQSTTLAFDEADMQAPASVILCDETTYSIAQEAEFDLDQVLLSGVDLDLPPIPDDLGTTSHHGCEFDVLGLMEWVGNDIKVDDSESDELDRLFASLDDTDVK